MYMIFDIVPQEIVEQILFYLNRNDIVAFFTAINKEYHILTNHFWKNICLREDFVKYHPKEEWHECFQIEMNKCLGYYTQISNCPSEKLLHVYSESITTHCKRGDSNVCKVYHLDNKHTFSAVQQIECDTVRFREELILASREKSILIYDYNHNTNIYDLYKCLPDLNLKIIGFDRNHYVLYNVNDKCFNVHTLYGGCTMKIIQLPSDVKCLIPVKNILHSHEIVVSVLSFEEAYKIKVYDLEKSVWTLDLVCFASTGITNDPNIWLGSHFVGCCDVSYRSRGIYFGMFKVWDKQGKLLIQEDIEPSNKHYLRCFFKDNFIILTTSDNSLRIGNSSGHWIYKLHTPTSFLDIKTSSGNLLVILLEDNKTIQVYDWTIQTCLYTIQLKNKCNNTMSSQCLYCPYNSQQNTIEVIHFLNKLFFNKKESNYNYFVANKGVIKYINYSFPSLFRS